MQCQYLGFDDSVVVVCIDRQTEFRMPLMDFILFANRQLPGAVLSSQQLEQLGLKRELSNRGFQRFSRHENVSLTCTANLKQTFSRSSREF